MAFKNQSKKKKKTKKKSTKKEEWQYEGGVVIEGEGQLNNKTDENIKIKRRNQERDERMRRGKNKMILQNKKKENYKKMLNKIKFNDILKDDEEDEKEGEEEGEEEGIQQQRKRPRIEPNLPKTINQIYSKVKNYLLESYHKSIANRNEEDKDDDDDNNYDDHHDDNIRSENDSGSEQNENNNENFNEQKNSLTKAGLILQIPDVEISNNDEKNNVIVKPPSGYFDWFFSSKEENNQLPENMTGIKIENVELLENLTTTITGKVNPLIVPLNIQQPGDIPLLQSMWENIYQNKFCSQIEGNLLSYLSCYVDLFIEGRDEKSDSHILNGVLWHILSHIVHSRLITH